MPAFGTLSDQDRWALAWYVGTLASDEAARKRGEALWQKDASAKGHIANLGALTTQTEATLAPALGVNGAHDLLAYLRSNSAVVASAEGGVPLARTRLQESLAAARAGKTAEATRLGLSAYLDGFEPLEPKLSARNKELMVEIETGMLSYRAALSGGKINEAEVAASRLDALFSQAETELDAGASDATTTFAGALTILLREGVEALLIVVGMKPMQEALGTDRAVLALAGSAARSVRSNSCPTSDASSTRVSTQLRRARSPPSIMSVASVAVGRPQRGNMGSSPDPVRRSSR